MANESENGTSASPNSQQERKARRRGPDLSTEKARQRYASRLCAELERDPKISALQKVKAAAELMRSAREVQVGGPLPARTPAAQTAAPDPVLPPAPAVQPTDPAARALIERERRLSDAFMLEKYGTLNPTHVAVAETLRGLVEDAQFAHAMRVAVLEDDLRATEEKLRELMTGIERHLAPTAKDESHESCAYAAASCARSTQASWPC